jgi:hypothetical protein
MNKIITTLSLIILSLLTPKLQAQIVENFNTSEVLSNIGISPDEVNAELAENALRLIVPKDSLQVDMVYEFAMSAFTESNCKMSIDLRSDVDMVISATLLDADTNLIAIAPKQTIYASASGHTYFFDLSDSTYSKLIAGTEVEPGMRDKIKFMYFSVTKASASANADTIFLSNLKIGSNVTLPSKTSTYSNDFSNTDLGKEWVSERNALVSNNLSYVLNVENGALKMDIIKSGHNGLWFYPKNTLLDLSKKPLISLKAKATRNTNLTIWLWGNNNLYTFTGITFPIKASDELRTYYFDFTDKLKLNNGAFIDPAAIKGILIAFESGTNYRGTVTFDDIKIGEAAEIQINQAPTINPVEQISFFNIDEIQEFELTGIGVGSPEENQKLTFEVPDYDTDLIFSVSISHIDGANTAKLFVNPNAGVLGETELKIIIKDNGGTRNGGKDLTEFKTKIKIIDPVALDKANAASGFKIFPNPVENELKIESSQAFQNVSIADSKGRILVQQNNTTNFSSLNLSDLEKGIYLLQIKQNDKIFVSKLVK